MRRDVLYAVGTFAVGLVLLASSLYIRRTGIPDWLLVIPLAITCVGVAVRRSAPLAALALGVVAIVIDVGFSGPSLPTALVFTDNLYAATLYGPARLARWLLSATATIAVCAAVAAGYFAGDWRMLAQALVQTGLILVIPVTTAMVLRQHRDQAIAERARAEQVARLSELDRQAAVLGERTRMARELHDMIANHFSAIAIQSTAVLSRRDLDPETVRTIMESIRANSLKGMSEMRTMIGLLREGEPDDATRPRLADVGDLAERSRKAGLATGLTIEGGTREVPVSVDLAGYRIIQESLTNALKHGTTEATITVVYEPRRVTLTIENPVDGRPPGLPGSGAGLIGMRERTTLLGGEFAAGPHGDGWRVHVTIPTDPEEAG